MCRRSRGARLRGISVPCLQGPPASQPGQPAGPASQRPPPEGPRAAQDHLQKPQMRPKTAPRGPKTASRAPKIAPRGPENDPRPPPGPRAAQEVIGRSSTTRSDDYQIISHGKAEPQSPTLSRSAARGHRKTIHNTLRLLSDRRSWQGKCKIDRFHSTF